MVWDYNNDGEQCRWRGTGTSGKITDHWRSNCFFLKTDAEDGKTRAPAICYSISRHASPLHRGRLGPCSNIYWCALLARLGVAGGRKQTGLNQRYLWKSWRSGWGQLGGFLAKFHGRSTPLVFKRYCYNWGDDTFPKLSHQDYYSKDCFRSLLAHESEFAHF